VLGIQWNEYGGFWTDGNDWCAGWEGGEPVWKMTDVTEEKGR
jgi:hypothetical protein